MSDRTTLLLLPGASLMDIRPIVDGLLVSCPGCDASLTIRDEVGHMAFVHEDGCPVLAKIEAARQTYERTTVRHG